MATEGSMLDTLVVGAGPAGIGCALALDAVDGLTYGVVDRAAIGQSFLDWSPEQRLLTPSFTTNGYGETDLNAVHPATSPAYALDTDYLSGAQYARYLRGVATGFNLPILENTEVRAIHRRDTGFSVDTGRGTVPCRTIIWAGGEYHDRSLPGIPGARLLDHSSTPPAWAPHDGPVVIIGAYESGIDLACHHIADGADVVVVDGSSPWDAGNEADPSLRLAPRTAVRLREARATGRLTLIGASAQAVSGDPAAGYVVHLEDGQLWRTPERPIAATGFGPGLGPAAELFDRRPDGWPLLDEDDCSTVTPGLFLSGPAVRHDRLRFCFIYKYRQRFAHIARVIGDSLDHDCSGLDLWRSRGMLIDDLSCCGTDCAC